MKGVLVRNISLSLVITITSSVLSFLINKYFILNLGIENLGLMRLFTQSIFFLALLDMGLSTAATVAFYKPLMDDDKLKISSLYYTVKKFYEKISIIVLVLGLILTPLISMLIGEVKTIYPYIYWLLFILVLSMNYHLMKFSILFLADQKYAFVTVVSGGSLILEKALQLFVIIYFQSFVIFILVGILGFLLRYLFYRYHYESNYFKMKDVGVYDKSIQQGATKMIFHKLSNMIVYNTDYIIIVKFIGLSTVGIYSSYLMLTSLVMTVISILHNVLDPIVGKLVAKESDAFNLDLWFVFFRVCFFIGCVVGLVFYKVATPFVVLWLGDDFVLLGVAVSLIAINLFFDIVKWPMEIFKYKYAFYNDIHLPIIEVIINLTISIILVQYLGIAGVIIGTIVSNVIVVVFLKTFLVFKRCFKVGIYVYILELVKNTFFLILSGITTLYLFDVILVDVTNMTRSWWGLISYIAQVIAVVLISVSLVFSLRSKFRESSMKFVKFITQRG